MAYRTMISTMMNHVDVDDYSAILPFDDYSVGWFVGEISLTISTQDDEKQQLVLIVAIMIPRVNSTVPLKLISCGSV